MSIQIIPSGETLGASVVGLDLSKPLTNAVFSELLQALGRHGVLSYPGQKLTAQQLKAFSENFGQLEISVANAYQEPGIPEVMVLSNIVENGKPLGLADAGQDWHTDMSYNRMIAFTNVLYGIQIPQRNGESLGNTAFCNMHAAYDDLPYFWKEKLDGMTATHDFNKFWEKMRSVPGSTRPPLTPEQRAARPPVSQPVFLEHPITRRKVLYVNPGYAIRINELSQEDSDQALQFLFEHQTQKKYQYSHKWKVGDVLMWDNMGTVHNAIPDYRADEPRLIKRCQVMATRFFDDQGRPKSSKVLETATE